MHPTIQLCVICIYHYSASYILGQRVNSCKKSVGPKTLLCVTPLVNLPIQICTHEAPLFGYILRGSTLSS